MVKNTQTSQDFSPYLLPEFDLAFEEGKHLTSKDLLGRWAVIFLYPKDDTPGCTQESIDFTAYMAEFEALNCAVIGLSKDSLKSHAKFKSKHNLKPILLSDPDGLLIEALGSWVEKNMYGKLYMGIERSTFLVDPKGWVQAHWKSVKVKGHVSAVLDTLKVNLS
jgi:thioredoxin-dependent peroxiredoxin